jgi:dienelactone hydrolase
MGTVILIIAFVLEVAFAAYCIVTRSDQKKLRDFIRIGAFLSFILLALVSVIQWSFRWYALGALLLTWAVIGVWGLVRKSEKKEYKTVRTVFKALGTLFLVGIVLTPALIFPQYQLPKVTGTYQVATVNHTYIDKNRIETFTKTGENRKINVEFWYPKDGDGKYPLVVFSHGSGGVKTSNTSTFMNLASNGYVVCSIDHPYHSLFTRGSDGHAVTADPAYLQEYMNLNSGKYTEAEKFQIEHKWLSLRTADINFALDTILAQTQAAGTDRVYQLTDPEKIGLIGHSLGGESVAQVARERNDIDAVINLDADLGGEYLDYVDGRYVINDKIYPAPLLTIYSDDLVRLLDAIPDASTTVAVKHVSATSPNAYEVHITGTNHMSLTDLPLVSPFFASMVSNSVKHVGEETADKNYVLDEMNSIVLEFFNVYLKGDGSFTSTGTH